jgi:hypothetical protein
MQTQANILLDLVMNIRDQSTHVSTRAVFMKLGLCKNQLHFLDLVT